MSAPSKMEYTQQSDITTQRLAAIILLIGLGLTLILYLPGLGGTFHFDDEINLGWLDQVNKDHPSLTFIMNGHAGILGRPIALASFAPQAYAWPNNAEILIGTNIYLHLINGLLVTWLAFLIAHQLKYKNGHAAIAAAFTGISWMLLPILASSSLFIIQRMTLLSATFLLAGLIGYLYFRKIIADKPKHALIGMSLSIVLGGTLAAFSKENGALLPVLILALEMTLLTTPASVGKTKWKIWVLTFLVLPTIAMVAFLVTRFQYAESELLLRGFTANDRLLTEAHILWQYLYHAFFPSPSAFGPFHDDQFIHTYWLHPTSILAVGGWISCITIAYWVRKTAPLLTFAVTWYLLGHALESTTIPLELYFEHRNYIPLFGPVFALVVMTTHLAKTHYRPVLAIATLYLMLQSFMLYSVTSLWGNPALAGEMWHRYNPESKRAAQYLAQQLQEESYHHAARRTLQRYLEQNEDAHDVRIQILHISCGIREPSFNETLINELQQNLGTFRFQQGTFDALSRLYETIKAEPCEGVDSGTIHSLATQLLGNPAYRAFPIAYHNLNILIARIGIEKLDLDLTMKHIDKALDAYHNLPTLIVAMEILVSAGLHETAESFIDQAKKHRPTHPVKANLWDNELRRLSQELNDLKQLHNG